MRPISPKRLARLARDGKRLAPNSTFAAEKPSEPRRATKRTDPTRSTRFLVLVRDGYACVRCGQACGPGIRPYSIHHRKRRSQGGTNDLPNLILLCGSGTTGCHGGVHQLDLHDRADGYWLRSDMDPPEHRVWYGGIERGRGSWWYLHSDGSLGSEPEQ